MELIYPSCRESLSSSDREFVAGLMTNSKSDSEACLRLLSDPEERDILLDGDIVFEAILNDPESIGVSQKLYFYVLVRRVFRDAGIDSRELADYAATLLAYFSRSQNVFGKNTGQRQAFFYVIDALAENGMMGHCERFRLTVRLADQALFLTGVFRSHVEQRKERRSAPGLGFYESVGRSNYRIAGDHHIAQEFCLNSLYGELSDGFVEIRRALNRLVDEIIFLGDHPSLPELN
ncbi:hypothetical protein [Rubellicoccus peritrichatus]|uniref:Uncharacterized protein n=1 Tax=Rubellicoccus peritrichatus TaxID=3080537 RepID=A0AAQ3L7U2_9BACT|nr:hypothetical protein [Puniceicoccus sp. CR14]WOO41234.1 hypothetical protein RZN69_21645 [Puniceicoccus sp. CR14]